MSERKCGDCEFFELDTDDGGQCHRQPIAALWNPHEATPESGWPWVAISDWCGEFRPRAVAESATVAEFKVGDRVVLVSESDAAVTELRDNGQVAIHLDDEDVGCVCLASELRHSEEEA